MSESLLVYTLVGDRQITRGSDMAQHLLTQLESVQKELPENYGGDLTKTEGKAVRPLIFLN